MQNDFDLFAEHSPLVPEQPPRLIIKSTSTNYSPVYENDNGSFAVKQANDIVTQQTEDTKTNPERLSLAQTGKGSFVNKVYTKHIFDQVRTLSRHTY